MNVLLVMVPLVTYMGRVKIENFVSVGANATILPVLGEGSIIEQVLLPKM